MEMQLFLLVRNGSYIQSDQSLPHSFEKQNISANLAVHSYLNERCFNCHDTDENIWTQYNAEEYFVIF